MKTNLKTEIISAIIALSAITVAHAHPHALPLTQEQVIKSDQLAQQIQRSKPTAFIGFQPIDLSRAQKEKYNTDHGALVLHVIKDQPAHKAGIQDMDIILHIGDTKIQSAKSIYDYLKRHQGGEVIAMKYLRDGKVQSTIISLGRNTMGMKTESSIKAYDGIWTMTSPDGAATTVVPLKTNKKIVYSNPSKARGSRPLYSHVLENDSDYENLPGFIKESLEAMSVIGPDGKPMEMTPGNLSSITYSIDSDSVRGPYNAHQKEGRPTTVHGVHFSDNLTPEKIKTLPPEVKATLIKFGVLDAKGNPIETQDTSSDTTEYKGVQVETGISYAVVEDHTQTNREIKAATLELLKSKNIPDAESLADELTQKLSKILKPKTPHTVTLPDSGVFLRFENVDEPESDE